MLVLRDTFLVFRQQLRLLLREPAWIIIALVQPLLYLALFGPLLKQVVAAPGFPRGDSWQVFVPGLLIQLGMFGSLFVGFGLIDEMRSGVVERLRVTPASRLALLLGRVLRDTLVLVVQATLLTLVAVAFGLRIPLVGALITVAIVSLLGVSLSSLSYAVALRLKSEDALAQVLNTISVPILLLSGILLPMTLAPAWLETLSRFNPFRYVVDGARAAFLGEMGGSALVAGLIAAAGLAVVGLIIGTRTFQRESA
jgi:ABC-2 type transport system permease protein